MPACVNRLGLNHACRLAPLASHAYHRSIGGGHGLHPGGHDGVAGVLIRVIFLRQRFIGPFDGFRLGVRANPQDGVGIPEPRPLSRLSRRHTRAILVPLPKLAIDALQGRELALQLDHLLKEVLPIGFDLTEILIMCRLLPHSVGVRFTDGLASPKNRRNFVR
jgi:hypothetical protein